MNSYNRALSAYYSNTDEEKLSTQWWQTNMPEIIARASTKTTEPFKVLAVGTGHGQPLDDMLLKMLCASQEKVVYTVVEPNRDGIEEFQEQVKDKYNSVEFKWFCMTWQDFQDNEWNKDGSQYNIIHFLHSLYYCSETEEEVKDRVKRCYYEMLNAGGAMVVSLINFKDKNVFGLVSVNIWWLKAKPKYNTILKIASEEGWKVDAEELNASVFLSKLFDEGSVEGNLLLDFFTHKENFRQNASKEELETTLKYFKDQLDGESNVAYPQIFDFTTVWKET